MVDGIIELEYPQAGRRRIRELIVRKLRGSAYLEGTHGYVIGNDGITVFPRAEASIGARSREDAGATDVSLGRAALDRLVGGSLVRARRHSS